MIVVNQVLPSDVDDVAKEILLGVEEAISDKKKEYITNNINDVQKFSLEVNFVIQSVASNLFMKPEM